MRILYVEDNPGDAALLRYGLADTAPHVKIDWAASCAEAIDKLSLCTTDNPGYDLLLADMQLPDGKGVSLLPYLQEHCLQIPLVVITGLQDEASAVSAIKAGALDYVVKSEGYLSKLPEILDSALIRYRTDKARQARPIYVLYVCADQQEQDATIRHFNLYAPFLRFDTLATANAALDRLTGRTVSDSPTIDIILIDDHIMDLPPLDFLKEIRLINRRGLPVIMVSTESHRDQGLDALRMGADDYIVKNPGYLEYLPSAIENAFNRAQIEREKKALKDREEYFQLLIENVSDIIIVSDVKAQITYCSASVERCLGYRPEELVHKNIYYKVHSEDRMKAEEQFRLAVECPDVTGTPREFRLLCADGTWRWMESLGRSVMTPSGDQAVVFNIRDIMERKTAEQALVDSEARLSEAIKLARIVYWVRDPDAHVFIFNDPFYKSLGTTAEAEGGYEMMAEAYAERFIHPDDRALFYQTLDNGRVADKSLYQLEMRVRRRDGEIRTLLTRVQVLRNENGEAIRIVGTDQDITERKQMEVALRESESKYRSLVENPLVGIIIQQDDRIRFANGRFCELVEYSGEDLIDQINALDMIHPDDKRSALKAFEQFKDNMNPVQEEIRIVKKNGLPLTVGIFMSRLTYDGRGAVAAIVIDRTLEKLLENQLRQSQKMEAIGTLAGGIAHDFNNILTALTGYGSLLKMEMESGKPARMAYVEAILSSSLKASNLTQGLLAFARQQVTTLKPLDLNDCVTGIKTMLGRLLTEDITLQTNFCSESATVMADSGQIDQIMINLAVNARDAMPGGGALTIETRSVNFNSEEAERHGLEGAGRYIDLSVCDTGVGIDEKTKEHIFEPFYTTKEPGKGTGLGLATVYGIVKKHHGSISVYSEKGQGTIFRIYLPAIEDQSEEEQKKPTLVGGTETIMLAEDDESVRDSVSTVLERFGYTVLQAVDGQEAIDLFSRNTGGIDLLLLDSVMPRKNGRQAYDEIHAIKPDVKVIFMSGYTRDVVLDKGVEEKRFDFLSKPVPHDILLEKLREVLDR